MIPLSCLPTWVIILFTVEFIAFNSIFLCSHCAHTVCWDSVRLFCISFVLHSATWADLFCLFVFFYLPFLQHHCYHVSSFFPLFAMVKTNSMCPLDYEKAITHCYVLTFCVTYAWGFLVANSLAMYCTVRALPAVLAVRNSLAYIHFVIDILSPAFYSLSHWAFCVLFVHQGRQIFQVPSSVMFHIK